jgi:hypothetical protein
MLGQDLQQKEFLGSKSGKFMPSNLSGFYMPYTASQNDEKNQYGYDIDIDIDSKAKEEGKYMKKPPLSKHYSKDDDEDDIAVPLEDTKSYSRSPVRNTSKDHHNGSFVHKPNVKYGSKNNGSVPSPQLFANYEVRKTDTNKVSFIYLPLIEYRNARYSTRAF